MKTLIVNLNYSHLRNEIHVEFHDVMQTLFGKYPPASMGIQAQYDTYKPLYDAEVSALDIVIKSDKTAEINAQNIVRDNIYRGFADAVKSAQRHFDPAKRAAAQRAATILERYGNIAAKSYDAQTAAIDDMLREFGDAPSSNWNADIALLMLGEWLTQLYSENQKFKELILERYQEQMQRPSVRMKDARAAVDAAFRTLLTQVEALTLVNGAAAYENFIKETNLVIERYRNILAQQAGRRANKEHNP
jgi:hypothetical protein